MYRLFLIGFILVGAASAQAEAVLPVLAASPSQLRVDGDVGEWRGAKFQKLGSDSAGSAEVALAFDPSGLFVGARVRDDAFVRTPQPSAAEDALVLRLAFPERGKFVESELWLFAGRIGKSPASVQVRAGGVLRALKGGAQIVEGPSPGGYALEAFLPWSSFEGGADWSFARGALRLHDVDATKGRATGPSTAASTLTAAKLPWLAFDGGPVPALSSFLRAKNLEQTASKLDFVGDVRADGRAERVLVIGPFVVVSGTGGQFAFTELPVSSAGDLLSADLRDLTADGKPELVLRLRQQNDLGKRELVRVYGFASEAPAALFGAEVRKQTAAGTIDAKIAFERGKIELSAGAAKGLGPDNYQETPPGEVIPIPLPWGAWKARVYAWDGKRFALASERENPKAEPQPSAAAAPPAAASETIVADTARGRAPDTSKDALAPLDAYKQARGVGPEVRPRFAQSTNLIGDSRPETLAVFGRELAVTGEAIGGDAGFFYLGLPVADPADVLGLQTGDLTGDGRREILVRVRQRISDVQRELMYCYGLSAQRATQLVVVEVSRARGGQRIDNKVTLVPGPDKQRSVLTIEPGVARGWSASDYPFTAESLDGIEPLLLPWKDQPASYVFERDRLIRRAPNVRTSN
jgi:hypothetical protein